ncbi:ankyrin repeat domain-containing protein 60-like isoform X2 [Hydractinia symbiolongicarpus]|uniref:ankyrin repeat domain-containing protein 60-like isoform X2 n=1 Tax=Hydractinia symbiolongicarpus TaxID=13093 RepID=UPI002550F4F1|nr:ankyrin repeat domain-containing protein 60-like isoform X2 [Hydractinia symbiolongicarpus]
MKLYVYIETTKENVVVTNVNKNLTVSKLKERIEDLVGIPSHLLELFYLDECPLLDSKPLSYFHILSDAHIKARGWKTNKNLIQASRDGDWEALHKEILASCRYEIRYDHNKALSALLIACYHGNAILVEKLLKTGVNCRACFHSGKDALCVAVSRGQISCLQRKVRSFEWKNNRTSLTNWSLQERIKRGLDRIEETRKVQTNEQYSRLTNSQMYDSALSTWFKSTHAQIYLCEILDSQTKSTRRKKLVFKP